MPYTKADDAEFEWVDNRLVHKPTGYEWWWAYPGSESGDVRRCAGKLGDMLSEGPAYKLDELTVIASRLMNDKRKA